MSWASEFPEELRHKPNGLVVLAGLDSMYNAVHKAVWDLFCNNRKSDRVPLNFATFPADHEYPRAKPKVQYFPLQAKNLIIEFGLKCSKIKLPLIDFHYLNESHNY